jgi:hypothetical protein
MIRGRNDGGTLIVFLQSRTFTVGPLEAGEAIGTRSGRDSGVDGEIGWKGTVRIPRKIEL